jgi:4-amino-4-deoxy-L-arabinose transferase-like glycosyltransferase
MEKRRRQLLWIALAGLALRLAVVPVFVPERMNPFRDYWSYDVEVGKLACSIASGHGFSDPLYCRGTPPQQNAATEAPYYEHTGPSSMEPPVFVFLLAGIFAIFGIYSKASLLVALFINCSFSALTAVPVYGIARRCFSDRVGLWAAWLWAVFPYSVYWAAYIPWATSLTTLLFTTLILCALDLESTSSVWTWFKIGLLGGFAALVDPVVLSTLPFVGIWLCYRHAKRGTAWKLPAAAAVLALIMPLVPWVARNYVVFEHHVFLRDPFWMAFRVGNSANAVGWWDDNANPGNSSSEMEKMIRLGELGYMAEERRQSFVFLHDHPVLFASLVVRRAVYVWTGFWSFNSGYLKDEPFDLPNIPFDTALTILTLIGLRRMFLENHSHRWLFALILLTFPVLYYVTIPLSRYRGPIDPEVVMLSVYGVISYRDARREARTKSALAADSVG